MHWKRLISISFILAVLILTTSCSEKEFRLSELAYNNCETENLVYLYESKQYVPYVVMYDNASENTVLLLRKEALPLLMRYVPENKQGVEKYEDGSIDYFLCHKYVDSLSEIQDIIKRTDVIIPSKDPEDPEKTVWKTIKRKAFLLSAGEMWSDTTCMPPDTEPYRYFSEQEHRVVNFDHVPSEWWLRTICDDTSCWVVDETGELKIKDSHAQCALRPVICVNSQVMTYRRDKKSTNQYVLAARPYHTRFNNFD